MAVCCASKSFFENELLDDMENKPHEVFLNDMMFLLCQECKILWVPPCYETYSIHPDSPLDDVMRAYIKDGFRIIYAKTEINYYYSHIKGFKSYWEMCDTYTEDLKIRLREVLSSLIEKNTFEVFFGVLKFFITCIVLYQRDMHDALCFGVTGMTEVFGEYLRKKRYSFDYILQRISRICSSPKLPRRTFSPDLVNKLHNVFARDLVFFMCLLSRIAWFPNKSHSHTIFPNSPLTAVIRDFAQKARLGILATYEALRARYGNDEAIFQAYSYGLTLIMDDVSASSIPQVRSVEKVLMLIVKTTNMSAQLHKRGMLDVLDKTLELLTIALFKCNKRNNGRIFDLFHALASLALKKSITLQYKYNSQLDMHYFNTR